MIIPCSTGQHSSTGPRARQEDACVDLPIARFGGGHLLAVADGISAYPRGDIASTLACQRLVAMGMRWQGSPLDLEGTVRTAFAHVQAELLAAHARPGFAGMGTTLTAVFAPVLHRQVLVGHVGDCQAVLVRPGAEPHPITRLHRSPEGVLQRWMGAATSTRTEPELVSFTPEPGDALVLMSDGVHEHVDSRGLYELVERHRFGEEGALARALVSCALESGGNDNATALVARWRG